MIQLAVQNSSIPHVDIHQRFREELRQQQLPNKIILCGNTMHKTIATQLLKLHAPKTIIVDADDHKIKENVPRVNLFSMETYSSMFLRSFMEEHNPPQAPFLLHTIPEQELVKYAKNHKIAIEQDEKDDVKDMLDRIAAQQPQTYFSLARSAWRLKDATEVLREKE